MIIHETGTEIGESGEWESWDIIYPDIEDEGFNYSYTFKGDGIGTYNSYSYNDPMDSWSITYSLENNRLSIHEEPDPKDEVFIYQIKQLSNTQLILYEEVDDDEDTKIDGKITFTFKKL